LRACSLQQLARKTLTSIKQTGLAEDKHAAANELMQKLTDVKRMGGRKSFEFDHVYAETKALADGGCLLSKVRSFKRLYAEHPSDETCLLHAIQCKLAALRPEFQEELMDIYGQDLDLVQVELRCVYRNACSTCVGLTLVSGCQFKLDVQTFAILVSESGSGVSYARFAV
jgi:hypothetical protein